MKHLIIKIAKLEAKVEQQQILISLCMDFIGKKFSKDEYVTFLQEVANSPDFDEEIKQSAALWLERAMIHNQ